MLGIDPGLARTGIAVVAHTPGAFRRLHSQVVRTKPDQPLAERLAQIAAAVSACAAEHAPSCAALERIFMNENPHASLLLGQARGAALGALGACGISVAEIPPRTVKQNITGDSRADKKRVAESVRALLKLPAGEPLAADAADALAIAIAYRSTTARLRRGRRR